jgi:hypothetical protein
MINFMSKRKIYQIVEEGIIFFEFASLPLKFKPALLITLWKVCNVCVKIRILDKYLFL